MLRALGVLFLVGCCFAAGIAGVRLSNEPETAPTVARPSAVPGLLPFVEATPAKAVETPISTSGDDAAPVQLASHAIVSALAPAVFGQTVAPRITHVVNNGHSIAVTGNTVYVIVDEGVSTDLTLQIDRGTEMGDLDLIELTGTGSSVVSGPTTGTQLTPSSVTYGTHSYAIGRGNTTTTVSPPLTVNVLRRPSVQINVLAGAPTINPMQAITAATPVPSQGPSVTLQITVTNLTGITDPKLTVTRNPDAREPKPLLAEVTQTASTTVSRTYNATLLMPGAYEAKASYSLLGTTVEAPVTITVHHEPPTSFAPSLSAVVQKIPPTTEDFRTDGSLLLSNVLLAGPSATVLARGTATGRFLVLRKDDGTVVLRDGSGNERRVAVVAPTTDVLLVISGELPAGVHVLKIMDLWTGESSAALTIVVPEPSKLFQPQITQTSNGQYAPLSAKVTDITVYDTFLRLKGIGCPLQGALEFLVFHDIDRTNAIDLRQQPSAIGTPTVDANGHWQVDLGLPEFRDADPRSARLIVVGKKGTHILSKPMTFVVQSNTLADEKPSGLKVAASTLSPTRPDLMFINKSEFDVTGDYTFSTSDLAKDTQTLILDATGNVRGEPSVLSAAANASGQWTVRLTDVQEGEHVFRAVFARGDKRSAPSAPITVVVKKGSPKVKSVVPPNLGTEPGAQQLTITFSPENPLDTSSAGYENNYVLLGSNGTSVFDRGTEQIVRPSSADYEPSSNSVVLKFDAKDPLTTILPDVYQLRINAHRDGEAASIFTQSKAPNVTVDNKLLGIKDRYGNFLEGAIGQPGSDYVLVMTKQAAATKTDATSASAGSTIPTVRRGLPDSTGPYVSFREYESRPPQSGFNPSDKVIERDVRLYYFRDGHRIVQLVNRRAKSYNREAVDVAQQLADTSRREAESATDARLDLENTAINAAKAARQAEETLREHQQALIAARQQSDTANNQLAQVTADLQDANVALDRTRAARDAAANELDAAQKALAALPMSADEASRTAAANRVQTAQSTLSSATARVQAGEDEVRHISQAQSVVKSEATDAKGQVDAEETRVTVLLAQVQTSRDLEVRATEAWDKAEQKEQRAYEEGFLREVAAKREDPDTYAPGDPGSYDPVAQVSLSVVGEGLIHLRGPRKGVNIIHTMINDLDAPVGQVRLAVHTVQINGEHGDRMEKVAMRIQRYIDHSRFLTTQSAQMLRNAVVTVASRHASACDAELAGLPNVQTTQADRDRKYQAAFFGSEFIAELAEMDSEFLHTGNKVLSLHSMDTTSLSSALFLLALAKNDIRAEILAEFECQVQCKLPQDELAYFDASGAERKFRHQEFKMLAPNAKFVSLKGFFDAQVAGTDTLNPLQREFIRLAQIFKSRLITEVELRQRVLERSLIEDRISNNYQEMLRKAAKEDEAAAENLRTVRIARQKIQSALVVEFAKLRANVDQVVSISPLQTYLEEDDLKSISRFKDGCKSNSSPPSDSTMSQGETAPAAGDESSSDALDELMKRWRRQAQTLGLPPEQLGSPFEHQTHSDETLRQLNDQPHVANVQFHQQIVSLRIQFDDQCDIKQWTGAPVAVNGDHSQSVVSSLMKQWEAEFSSQLKHIEKVLSFVTKFRLDPEHQHIFEREQYYYSTLIKNDNDQPSAWNIHNLWVLTIAPKRLGLLRSHILSTTGEYLAEANQIVSELSKENQEVATPYSHWLKLQSVALNRLRDPQIRQRFEELFAPINTLFDQAFAAESAVIFQKQNAAESRRPLDHKKFLDMLIDDVEEKYIDLLDGTRAHTANIDNYLARLATALEDDFNTQFYHPAFRYVRETSYYWDVQLGAIQTESILTNNREFAKVSPQATMEFDLPKRDILINEAFQSALAAYNDYGALMNDPSFLALTRMYGGQPAGQTYGEGEPAPQVRNVLPGLPSQTDATHLTQAKNNVPRIGANLEALIPDPAVYKFETGTGFEIRPVIGPDGQAVVFHLQYMYTTNIREPVRADEKHLGRVKRHFIDTDVTMGNYELREVSRYQVALKASRTSRGVPGLEDVPGLGVLFRPLPQQESSLQQNLILAQTVIYPTLFDLMGLRWAPAVADLDSLSVQEREFVYRNREKYLRNEVFDYSSLQVDDFMRIPEAERRGDLYRTQETIPYEHPNGYKGPGLNIDRSELEEGYEPQLLRPKSEFVPERMNEKPGEWMSEPAPIFKGSSAPQPSMPQPSWGVPKPESHSEKVKSTPARFSTVTPTGRASTATNRGSVESKSGVAPQKLTVPQQSRPLKAAPNGTGADQRLNWLRRLDPRGSKTDRAGTAKAETLHDDQIVPAGAEQPPPSRKLPRLWKR